MLNNFKPFSPDGFQDLIKELRCPERQCEAPEIPRSLRGYGRIASMYQEACFDGELAADVDIIPNPSRGNDAYNLSRVAEEFKMEVARVTKEMSIPSYGYSVCVQDRSCVRRQGDSEYCLLVDILDGDLNSAVIAEGCAQSFTRAPVSYFVSWNPSTREQVAFPIFTKLAFAELMRSVEDSSLTALKGVPAQNFAFVLMCKAIERAITKPHFGEASLYSNPACYGRNSAFLMPIESHCDISRSVASLRSYGSFFEATCAFDGEYRDVEITFQRHRATGRVSASARVL